MQVALRSVIVNKRVRRDLGDLEGLMESMRKYGQLAPILINRKYELIAGHRRLESARRLGWQSIEAVIADHDGDLSQLEIELEENIQRAELSGDELAEGLARLERLRRKGFFRRLLDFFTGLFKAIFQRHRL